MAEHIRARPRYPGGWKALWGVGAFVVGYVVTYLWVVAGSGSPLDRVIVSGRFTDPVAVSKTVEGASMAGWRLAEGFYYGGHMVSTIFTLDSGNRVSVNLATNAGGQYLLLLVLPPVLLALAGYMAVRDVSDPFDFRFDLFTGRTWQRYAVNGAGITMSGYLPVALAVALFTLRTPQPNVIMAWIVAGLLYPIAFGAVGGAIAYYFDDEYESYTTRLDPSQTAE